MEYSKELHSSCFPFLPEAAAKKIFTRLEFKNCKAGEDISSLFCFVVAGELDVRREVTTGGISKSHLLARITKGSFVGEGTLFKEKKSFCSVVCAKESSVLILRADSFEQFLQDDQKGGILLLKHILSVVHGRLGSASARLVHIL